MTDIVDRLKVTGAERQRTTAHDKPEHYLHVVAKISNADGLLMTEAADLITVLRAENERLRQVLENTQQARVLQGKAITDASNEIERLRSALAKAANDLDDWGGYVAAQNARAALEGK